MFDELPKNHFGAILADPPWQFEHWGKQDPKKTRDPFKHYSVLSTLDLVNLPVVDIAAKTVCPPAAYRLDDMGQ